MADQHEQSTNVACASSGVARGLTDAFVATVIPSLAAKVASFGKEKSDDEPLKSTFLVADAALRALSGVFPGLIVPVQNQLVETVKVSNRIVSFILDGTVHFGTGILVGERHVLTAAHLFFEDDGQLIDLRRASRITVEAHTTFIGNIIMEGPRRTTTLSNAETLDGWLIDPKIQVREIEKKDGASEKRYVATRDVNTLDFVIVELARSLDEEIGFGLRRRWFDIPSADAAEVLATNLGLRVFQFLDREALLSSSGRVFDVVSNGYRVRHTASTADSASGAFICDDRFRFLAMHLGGSPSGELPKFNRALPIRRIAEEIDRVREDGTTVRQVLTKSETPE